MKILQLTGKIPYPEKDGGVIAVNVFTRELLHRGCEVKVLAMNTSKHFANLESIPESYRHDTRLETVSVDTHVKPFDAMLALLRGKSYNVERFKSRDFGLRLIAILQKETFDIIQLEGIYVTLYIPIIRKFSKAKIILRAHNVEWKIWQTLALEEKSFLKKSYLKILAKQLKKYEKKHLNLCDGIIAFTRDDIEVFKSMGCTTPIEFIPFGVDRDLYIQSGTSTHADSTPALFFIGALDWMPNINGATWFLDNVWVRVNKSHPETKLHIAGRNMPDKIKKSDTPNVIIHGEVDNAIEFMRNYSIMIVPLFSGSGIRIKIIEGMALGKAIVSTTLGAQGIECVNGENILIADTAEDFAEAIKRFLDNQSLINKIGDNARKLVETKYDIHKIVAHLIEYYKDI